MKLFSKNYNICDMTKQADILSDFLDTNTIEALPAFLDKSSDYNSSADLIAVAFGGNEGFSSIDESGAFCREAVPKRIKQILRGPMRSDLHHLLTALFFQITLAGAEPDDRRV